MKRFNFIIATFFGVGKIPFAPGTWASLAAVPCFYPLMAYPLHHIAVLVGIYFLGVYTSTQLERSMGVKDPTCAVIDEVLGMGISMVWIPRSWPFLLMAIILFRIFDIWKPFPIKKTEKLPVGWGIMTDDLLAGIYANIWVHIGAFLVKMIV
jgi:phosphatidylglycerophosphatase A